MLSVRRMMNRSATLKYRSHFDEATGDRKDARQIELGLGIIASGLACLDVGQDAVAADDSPGVGAAHEQVLAKGIEAIGLDAEFGAIETRTHFVDENLVAQ